MAELKAHLSRILADVRAGETVIVCDRRTPIARLVPFDESGTGLVVLEPKRSADELRRIRGVKTRRPVDVVRLLRESRDHR